MSYKNADLISQFEELTHEIGHAQRNLQTGCESLRRRIDKSYIAIAGTRRVIREANELLSRKWILPRQPL
jgi:hypothetical protein